MKLNYHLGGIVSGWLLAFMIIFAQWYPPFKDLLKATFSHHWIGKAVITFIVFVGVSCLFPDVKKVLNQPVEKFSYTTMLYTVGLIGLFYLLSFLLEE